MTTFTITISGILGTLPNHAVVSVPRVLGTVTVVAGIAPNRVSVMVPRLLGGVSVRATQVNRATVAVVGLLGRCRIRARCLADEWSAARFPSPVVSSYGYSKDAGVTRTEFRSGATRQRRRWGDGRRTVNATFNISSDDLYSLESFINEKGYDWFTIGLITGDNTSEHVLVHVARVKGNPQVGSIHGDTLSMSLELELQG